MKKTLFTIILACATIFMASAQGNPYDGQIRVAFPGQEKNGDQVTFRAEVDFTTLGLHTQQMVLLTPVLRSTTSREELRFAPVAIQGGQRARIIDRAERLGGYDWEQEPAQRIVLKKQTERTLDINLTVPFEKWMRHSELVIIETVSACGDRPQDYGGSRQYSSAIRFTEPYTPVYAVSYLVPEVQPVKTLSDTYSARLQFPVGQSTLQPGFGNNAQILAEVDKVVQNIKTDELLTVKRIVVKGYASPEGNSASNQRLSQARAQAFVDYLHQRHNYRSADNLISAQGMGEDWEGLRQRIENSHLADRDAILSAIAYNTDNDRRDAAVKALSGGRTWRTLLDNYFPELRRNEYTIEYEVRGFNAQEAKSYVWTRPQLLSLNELFMVAKLYDPASKEYKDVFDIAARVYPDSPVAQFNTGAMEVENGAYDSAIDRLSRIDTPEAWNNLGVAYWHKGEYNKSQEYLQKAANAGLPEAKANIEQYNRWSERRED